jgi:RNA polymerase sigma factor (sigma-70 family)
MEAAYSDRELYIACGNEGSLEQVTAFETLWAGLYRIAAAMLRDYPAGEALAADCAQQALLRIHRNREQCRDPDRFQSWAGQIVRRIVIDELRRPEQARRGAWPAIEPAAPAETEALLEMLAGASLRELLQAAIANGGLSERSQRVVTGRYFAERSDEDLARAESELQGSELRPSHIQVTRAKNLAKLRHNSALREAIQRAMGDGS